jgi:hypothetical protein
MISKREGRSRSVRTESEKREMLKQQIAELTPDQRKLVMAIMRDSMNGESTMFDYLAEHRWLRKPVSVEQFLDDPYYMGGTSQTLYPEIKKDIIEMFETPGIREVVLTGSIGYGKTTFISFATARLLYELSCLRAPQLSYGLSPGSEIVVALMSKSLHLSRSVMKTAVDDKIKLSPYFMEHFKPDFRRDSTMFPNSINLSIGSCFSERILGMNVLGGAMDEANFMVSKGQVISGQSGKKDTVAQFDLAEKMYAGIVRRIKSRFLKAPQDLPGLMILASSAATIDSFTNRKIRDSSKDPHVFCRDYAAWDVKPKQNFSGNKFWVLIGSSAVRSRIITNQEEASKESKEWLEEQGCRLIEVPIEYYEDFDRDLENAIRDIAGISTHAISAFIHRVSKIDDCATQDKHPFTTDEYEYGSGASFVWHRMCDQRERKLAGGYKEMYHTPKRNPSALRYIHIDPSLSGDSTGLAMGHIEKWVEVVRRGPDGEEYSDLAPHIVIDLMLRVNPPSGEQIFLPDVRRMVYELIDHGFNLQGFSCDSYQSAEMIQQMKNRGVNSEVLSVDRTMDAYDALKSAIYEGRIEFYRYEPFFSELRALEYDRVRGKVDHPVAGTKDVADAVAGVVYGLIKGVKANALVMPDFDIEGMENDDWVSEGRIMVASSSSVAESMSQNQMANTMPMPFIMG